MWPRSIIRWLALAAMPLSGPACALAQPAPRPATQQLRWVAWMGDHPINTRWSLHFDAGWRQVLGSAWDQWLARPGLNFHPRRNVTLSAAYSYFDTHPDGLLSDAGQTPEHRLQEQFEASHRAGNLTVVHRSRIDHRWLGGIRAEPLPRHWNLQHRLRQLARVNIPLKQLPSGRLLYLGLYDEIFLRYGYSGVSHFEQNRIYAGIGIRPFKGNTSVEAGAFHQRFLPLVGGGVQNNFVFLVTVTNRTPLRNLLRRSASD